MRRLLVACALIGAIFASGVIGWLAAETFSPTLEKTRALRAGVGKLTSTDCRDLAREAGASAKEATTHAGAAVKTRASGALTSITEGARSGLDAIRARITNRDKE